MLTIYFTGRVAAYTICALLSFFFILLSDALAAPAAHEILAEFSIHEYWCTPRVPVSFNDKTYEFLLDTGSTASKFEPELASLLVRTGRKRLVVGLNGSETLSLYRSPEGTIGGVRLPSMEDVICVASGLNRLFPRRLDGVISAEGLQRQIIQFDYDHGKILLLRSVPRDAGLRLKFVAADGRFGIRGALGDSEFMLVLDTALFYYEAGTIPARKFDQLIDRGSLSVIDTSLVHSASGPLPRRDAIANVALRVGDYEHSGLVFSESSDPQSMVATLGIGYLRRYVVTFDFPGRAVYFAPSAQFRRVDASHDPGGIQLKWVGRGVVISNAWGPALEAGVKVGDAMVAVDDHAINNVDEIGLVKLLSQSDRPTAMTFRHGDGSLVRFVHDQKRAQRRAIQRQDARRAQQ